MKPIQLITGACLLALAAAAAGCTKNPTEDSTGKETSYTVKATASSTAEVEAKGGAVTIDITTEAPLWTATSSAAWAKVSPAQGNGNGKVTVTLEENSATEARTATITIVAGTDRNGDGQISEADNSKGSTIAKQTVSVRQAAAKAVVPDPTPGEAPKADLFDWVVNDDKSAKDVSAAGLTVIHEDGTGTELAAAGEKLTVQKNAKTGLNDAYFFPISKKGADAVASATSYAGYYAAKYEDDPAYQAKLADGHSIECYFCSDFNREEDGTAEKEIKPFSSMQSGGTGFVFAKASHTSGHGHFCFILNTDGSGSAAFNWTDCGYMPEQGKWHHAVGVYDKNAQKIFLYMDGELKSTGEAPGNYVQPAAKAGYWIVGGDPSGNDAASCTAAFKGNIAIARVYDAVLTADQVKALYDKVK